MFAIKDLPSFTAPALPLRTEYEKQLKAVMRPLPCRLQDKIAEAAYRILLVATAPIVYPVLVAADCLLSTLDGSADQILKKQVSWLKEHKPAGWKAYAWKLIRKGRHEDPCKELSRLRTMGVLTQKREMKLDKAIDTVNIKNPTPNQKLKAKTLMVQALEIKDLYGETHDVFIHAQAAKWVIFSHLIKEFTRKFQPEKDLHQYKFLRAPCNTVEVGFLNSCWNFIFGESKPDTVQDYLSSKWLPVFDSDSKVREQLISVDGYFYNNQAYESSLFFLINNDNIFSNGEAIQNFSKKVIQHFCPTLTDEKVLNAYAKRITQAAFKEAECGNLFVICLPKKDSAKIQYRAHPFGPPCDCHGKEDARKILDKLQKEEIVDKTNACSGWLGALPPIPQFRLYTPRLGPDAPAMRGRKAVFLLTPFAKEERASIKSPVKEIANEVHLKALLPFA